MTTETTEPTTQASDDGRRARFMKALSLAEQLMSEMATLPFQFEIYASTWGDYEPEIRFYFHMDIPGLRQFRDDQALTETTETRNSGAVYIQAARDDVRGVRVVAWTLTDPSSAEATEDAEVSA